MRDFGSTNTSSSSSAKTAAPEPLLPIGRNAVDPLLVARFPLSNVAYTALSAGFTSFSAFYAKSTPEELLEWLKMPETWADLLGNATVTGNTLVNFRQFYESLLLIHYLIHHYKKQDRTETIITLLLSSLFALSGGGIMAALAYPKLVENYSASIPLTIATALGSTPQFFLGGLFLKELYEQLPDLLLPQNLEEQQNQEEQRFLLAEANENNLINQKLSVVFKKINHVFSGLEINEKKSLSTFFHLLYALASTTFKEKPGLFYGLLLYKFHPQLVAELQPGKQLAEKLQSTEIKAICKKISTAVNEKSVISSRTRLLLPALPIAFICAAYFFDVYKGTVNSISSSALFGLVFILFLVGSALMFGLGFHSSMVSAFKSNFVPKASIPVAQILLGSIGAMAASLVDAYLSAGMFTQYDNTVGYWIAALVGFFTMTLFFNFGFAYRFFEPVNNVSAFAAKSFKAIKSCCIPDKPLTEEEQVEKQVKELMMQLAEYTEKLSANAHLLPKDLEQLHESMQINNSRIRFEEENLTNRDWRNLFTYWQKSCGNAFQNCRNAQPQDQAPMLVSRESMEINF